MAHALRPDARSWFASGELPPGALHTRAYSPLPLTAADSPPQALVGYKTSPDFANRLPPRADDRHPDRPGRADALEPAYCSRTALVAPQQRQMEPKALEEAVVLGLLTAEGGGGEGNCQRLCCARFACSWFSKVAILCFVCKCILLFGPLSRPMWIPISYDAGCQETAGDEEAPKLLGQQHDHSLDSCKRLCERTHDCLSIDMFNASSVCNMYAQPCVGPAAHWDQASSWQIARYCTAPNGSHGYVISDECDTNIEPPTWSLLVKRGIWTMLLSPVSWMVSLFVAVVYAYVSSIWFRRLMQMCQDLQLGGCCTKACGHMMFSVVWQTIAVVVGWAILSRYYFGWPHVRHPLAVPEMMEVPLMGVHLPSWPASQWAFNLASIFMLCLVIPQIRRRILEDVVPQILVLSIAWGVASAWFFGWPDFYSWPPRPPPMKADPIFGMVPQFPPMAWALDMLAMLLLVLIVCPCLRVYVAEAIAGLGVLVMTCFNSAATAIFGAATGVEAVVGTGTAAVAGVEGAAGTVATAVLAVETGVSAAAAAVDSAVATEAAAAADAVTAFLATLESTVAAEAAAASTAAAAAAQAAAAGGGIHLCTIL